VQQGRPVTPPVVVGFIGLGAMGKPIARNLLVSGFPRIILCHRDPAAPTALAALGETVVTSLAEVAGRADVIILMLPSSREVEAAVVGPDGLENVARPGQVIVDMGMSDPASTRVLARWLTARGIGYLDAPVTGGASGAGAGTLTIMVGGPARVLDRIRTILEGSCPGRWWKKTASPWSSSYSFSGTASIVSSTGDGSSLRMDS